MEAELKYLSAGPAWPPASRSMLPCDWERKEAIKTGAIAVRLAAAALEREFEAAHEHFSVVI